MGAAEAEVVLIKLAQSMAWRLAVAVLQFRIL